MLGSVGRSTIAVVAAAVLSAGAVAAQPTAPYPVGNFERHAAFDDLHSPPDRFVALRERTVFTILHPNHGRELWFTDGTPEGTRLLLDLCPGICSSGAEVRFVTPELVYFELAVPPGGPSNGPPYTALWRTDGTQEGTFPLGPWVTRAVGYLDGPGLFVFLKGGPDPGLWATDGTLEGTRLVVPSSVVGGAGLGEALGDLLVFPADTAFDRRELWVTDGTSAGTRQLVDLRADPDSFRRVGDRLLFTVSDRDLWATDGTAAGTVLLRERLVSAADSYTREFVVDGSRAFFTIGGFVPYSIWTSDGTPAGTYQVSPQGRDAQGPFAFRGRLFFGGRDDAGGQEPWVTDGSRGGARRFLDLCPGPCGSTPAFLGVAGGRLVFAADDGEHGFELWATEGTAAGTGMLSDRCPGSCDSEIYTDPVRAGPRLVIHSGGDAVGTDGTPAGTSAVARLGGFLGGPFQPTGLGTVGSRALLASEGLDGRWSLLVSDGTPGGTGRLVEFAADYPVDEGSEPAGLVELGGRVLFNAFVDADSRQVALMSSRGVPGETRTLVPPRFAVPSPTRRAGERVFTLGDGIWVTDGTPGGSVRLGDSDLLTTPFGSIGENLLAFDDRADDRFVRIAGPPLEITTLAEVEFERGDHDKSLDEYFVPLGDRVLFPRFPSFWATDGTPAGTVEVDANAPFGVTSWVRFGDEVFYLKSFDGLWAADGIAGHARQVCPPGWDPPNSDSVPRYLYAVGDRLLFNVHPRADAEEGIGGLWASDGGSGCARMAPGVTIDSRNLLPGVAAVLGDRLFFASDDGLHGAELWVSDGTPEGTALFADLRPGPGESRPHRMKVAGERLFFTATDGEHGYELWSTDGTPEGTVRHGDVAPGPGSSYPEGMTAAGGTLFFTADDGRRGRELWALPLATPDCAGPETLCLQGGRFRVQVRWRDQRSGNVGGGTALPFPGSDRTGMFWFFDAANVELIVKLLDGGPVNGFQWVFYGGLSDVEYWINVTDAVAGTTRTYRNPPGEICGRGDTAAFPSAVGVAVRSLEPESPAPAPPRRAAAGPFDRSAAAAPVVVRTGAGTSGSCQPGAQTLCLLDGRFQVTVEWRDQRSGDEGVGGAIPGTGKSGFFWFFHPTNVELVIKVLDGREVNGRFWVIYGGLSDVEYTIRVLDTETGLEKPYHNPPGEICGRADTNAF